jgi:hypothetical protein
MVKHKTKQNSTFFLVYEQSPGTPASSTTKTGRHDIAEILLKVALKHQKSNQIKLNHILRTHISHS